MHFISLGQLLLEQTGSDKQKKAEEPPPNFTNAYAAAAYYKHKNDKTQKNDNTPKSGYHAAASFKARAKGDLDVAKTPSNDSTAAYITKFVVADRLSFANSLWKDIKTDINQVRNQFDMRKSGYADLFIDQFDLRIKDPDFLKNTGLHQRLRDWLRIFNHHDIFSKPDIAKRSDLAVLGRPNDLKISKKLKNIFDRHKNMKKKDSIAVQINWPGAKKRPLAQRIDFFYRDLKRSDFPVISVEQKNTLINLIQSAPQLKYEEFCHYFLRPIFEEKFKSLVASVRNNFGLDIWSVELESLRLSGVKLFNKQIAFLMNASYLDPYANFTVKEITKSQEKWRKQKGSKWYTYVPYEIAKYDITRRGLIKLAEKALKISTKLSLEARKARASRGVSLLIWAHFLVDPVGEVRLADLKYDLNRVVTKLEQALVRVRKKPGSYDSKVVEEIRSIYENIQRLLLDKLRSSMLKVDDRFEREPGEKPKLSDMFDQPRYEKYVLKVNQISQIATDLSLPPKGGKVNEQEILELLQIQKGIRDKVLDAFGHSSIARIVGGWIKKAGSAVSKSLQKGINMGLPSAMPGWMPGMPVTNPMRRENLESTMYNKEKITNLVQEQINEQTSTNQLAGLVAIWDMLMDTTGQINSRPRRTVINTILRVLKSELMNVEKNDQGKVELELSLKSTEDENKTNLLVDQFFENINAGPARRLNAWQVHNAKDLAVIKKLSFSSDIRAGIQNRSLFGLGEGNDSYQVAIFPTHNLSNSKQRGPSVLYYPFSEKQNSKGNAQPNKAIPDLIKENNELLKNIIKVTERILSRVGSGSNAAERLNVIFIKSNLQVIKQIVNIFSTMIKLDDECRRNLSQIDGKKLMTSIRVVNTPKLKKAPIFRKSEAYLKQYVPQYRKWAKMKIKAWETICKVDSILMDNEYYVVISESLKNLVNPAPSPAGVKRIRKSKITKKTKKRPPDPVYRDLINKEHRLRFIDKVWRSKHSEVADKGGYIPLEPNKRLSYYLRLKRELVKDINRADPFMDEKRRPFMIKNKRVKVTTTDSVVEKVAKSTFDEIRKIPAFDRDAEQKRIFAEEPFFKNKNRFVNPPIQDLKELLRIAGFLESSNKSNNYDLQFYKAVLKMRNKLGYPRHDFIDAKTFRRLREKVEDIQKAANKAKKGAIPEASGVDQ